MNNAAVYLHDFKPDLGDMKLDIMAGLKAEEKYLHPKYFYDETGSKLFDQITNLPEYYIKRAELEILNSWGEEIAELAGNNCLLIEYGSGTSEKIRTLLNTIKPQTYLPLDISKEHLFESANLLSTEFPWLTIHATCVDYSKDIELPVQVEKPNVKNLGFFPGSSIGNFSPDDAVKFLTRARKTLGDSGALLIGVDLKKSQPLLHAAYNDTAGITAAFNLNILHHINNQLDGNIDISKFQHVAEYNDSAGRIEMYLKSTDEQESSIAEETISFKEGERIHTENSYKYHIDEFSSLVQLANFKVERVWTDTNELFAVYYLKSV